MRRWITGHLKQATCIARRTTFRKELSVSIASLEAAALPVLAVEQQVSFATTMGVKVSVTRCAFVESECQRPAQLQSAASSA